MAKNSSRLYGTYYGPGLDLRELDMNSSDPQNSPRR